MDIPIMALLLGIIALSSAGIAIGRNWDAIRTWGARQIGNKLNHEDLDKEAPLKVTLNTLNEGQIETNKQLAELITIVKENRENIKKNDNERKARDLRLELQLLTLSPNNRKEIMEKYDEYINIPVSDTNKKRNGYIKNIYERYIKKNGE